MIGDPLALSIAMVAVIALTVGGVVTIVKRREKTRGVLMLVCALVLLGNVLLWVRP